MEHIYPAFERGRIMKKELLWALRDYSYSALQLQYQDYPAGIISGCHISVEDDMLTVGKGIVKCQDFIFLLTEEERIPYNALLNANSPEEAALIFAASFERCADGVENVNGVIHFKNVQHSIERTNDARTIYNEMIGK